MIIISIMRPTLSVNSQWSEPGVISGRLRNVMSALE